MSDDNIINLQTKDYEKFRDAVDGQPARNEQLHDLLTGGSSVLLPDGSKMEITAEGLGFSDLDAAINMRKWLQDAVEYKGAKVVGSGYGFGQGDLDIEIEGHRYNVSIRPIG